MYTGETGNERHCIWTLISNLLATKKWAVIKKNSFKNLANPPSTLGPHRHHSRSKMLTSVDPQLTLTKPGSSLHNSPKKKKNLSRKVFSSPNLPVHEAGFSQTDSTLVGPCLSATFSFFYKPVFCNCKTFFFPNLQGLHKWHYNCILCFVARNFSALAIHRRCANSHGQVEHRCTITNQRAQNRRLWLVKTK